MTITKDNKVFLCNVDHINDFQNRHSLWPDILYNVKLECFNVSQNLCRLILMNFIIERFSISNFNYERLKRYFQCSTSFDYQESIKKIWNLTNMKTIERIRTWHLTNIKLKSFWNQLPHINMRIKNNFLKPYFNKFIIANFGGPCFAANDKSETQWNADVLMSSKI